MKQENIILNNNYHLYFINFTCIRLKCFYLQRFSSLFSDTGIRLMQNNKVNTNFSELNYICGYSKIRQLFINNARGILRICVFQQ